MLPKKFENPSSNGDRSKILENFMILIKAPASNPLNKKEAICGINIKAKAQLATISAEKLVKIESTKDFTPPLLPAAFFENIGTKTEIETSEPAVIKMKSGIRKAV